MVTRHLQISGRVQGVGFRYSMQREAARLGLTGWVRNRRDGSVEALVQGDEAAVASADRVGAARTGGCARRGAARGQRRADASLAGFEQRPTL